MQPEAKKPCYFISVFIFAEKRMWISILFWDSISSILLFFKKWFVSDTKQVLEIKARFQLTNKIYGFIVYVWNFKRELTL